MVKKKGNKILGKNHGKIRDNHCCRESKKIHFSCAIYIVYSVLLDLLQSVEESLDKAIDSWQKQMCCTQN